MRSPSMSGPGSGTARSPSSRISKMPTSPAGPKRCLTAVSTRKAWWRSPSKDSTVSTRCSTARGPAGSPSLVTCPTTNSGTPVALARRVRRSTQARTWATLPAGWARAGSAIDCSESTTTRAGRCPSVAASIASMSGPSSASRRAGTRPRRAARTLTCVSDSSAEASSTSEPAAARDERTWKSRVDLPMPGGPKTSVTEPATTPPPSTRSSSPTPVGSGFAPSVDTAHSATGGARGTAPAPDRARALGGAEANVFHSPQLGHRPTQRSEVAAQAVQRKRTSERARAVARLAMAARYGRGVTADPCQARRDASARCRRRPRGAVKPVLRAPRPDEEDAILAVVFAAFSSPGRAGDEEVDIVRGSWAAAAPASAPRAGGGHRWRRGRPRARRAGTRGRAGRRGRRRGPGLRRAGPPRARRRLRAHARTRAARRGQALAAARAAGRTRLLRALRLRARRAARAHLPAGRHGLTAFLARRLGGGDASRRGTFAYCWEPG